VCVCGDNMGLTFDLMHQSLFIYIHRRSTLDILEKILFIMLREEATSNSFVNFLFLVQQCIALSATQGNEFGARVRSESRSMIAKYSADQVAKLVDALCVILKNSETRDLRVTALQAIGWLKKPENGCNEADIQRFQALTLAVTDSMQVFLNSSDKHALVESFMASSTAGTSIC
jgi:hypothetical protein